MSDFDTHITDKEIRNLLQWQMLERTDDPAIQKLIDMEAAIVFANDDLITVPGDKEKEFLAKITGKKGFPAWLKWLLPAGLITGIIIVLIMKNADNESKEASAQVTNVTVSQDGNNKEKESLVPADTIRTEEILTITKYPKIKHFPVDTAPVNDTAIFLNEMNNGKPILAGNTKLKMKEEAYKDEPNIPVLTQKQIDENNKYKQKMVKLLLRRDRDDWAFIPAQTKVYKGDTVVTGAFFMGTTEVTNKQYRTFIHDLLIQGRIDEYLKAVPDTMKWQTQLGSEPYTHYYFQHPAYDEYPVVNISREAAMMYCYWLVEIVYEKLKEETPESKKSSTFVHDYHLPTDVQWMAAARGGNADAVYPWEENDLKNRKGEYLANFKRLDEDYDPHAPSKDVTAPVKSYSPNKYGLYCMAGNVAEMVYVSGPKGKRLRSTPPYFDPGTKGGSWNSDSLNLKIEGKDEYRGITEGSPFIGFRVRMTYLCSLKEFEGKAGK